MKSNCIGIADLLCAYADGELAEQNIKIVEDHLAICENCSTILKMYKEISNSVNDTNVPAPDALRIGVMNRIQNEITPRKTDDNKLRRNYRMILTRFVPVAACLVVMLFVWQFWGDLFGTRHNTASPEAAMMPASAGLPDAAGGYTDDDGYYMSSDALDAAEESSTRQLPVNDQEIRQQNENPGIDEEKVDEYNQITEYISGAFAEIAFTGDLPPLLAGIDPQPFGSWFGWEKVFEIPSAELQILIDELNDRENVTVVFHDDNSNSTYVIVLYSYSGQ